MLVFIYPGELCEQHVFGSLSKQHNSPAELLNQLGGDAPAALRMQHRVARGGGNLQRNPTAHPKMCVGPQGCPAWNPFVLQGPPPWGLVDPI